MRFTVDGGSMLPFLRTLDVCVCEEVPPGKIEPGDLVIYDDRQLEEFVVHRVLAVPRNKESVLIKGDNEPSEFTENVPFENIVGKVVSVEKEGRTFDLKFLPRKCFNRFLAFLSRHDLTPHLSRRKFIDPFLLYLARNPLYVVMRKRAYRRLVFTQVRKNECSKVYATINGTRSSEASLRPGEKSSVIVSSHIRHRDRNPLFAEKFLEKICSTVEEQYGPETKIFILEGEFQELIKRGGITGSSKNIHLNPCQKT